MSRSIEDTPNNDILTIELAHIIWFLQRGRKIEDSDELHEAWREEHLGAIKLSQEVIAEMYGRGMLLDFFDQSLSRFSPKEDEAVS